MLLSSASFWAVATVRWEFSRLKAALNDCECKASFSSKVGDKSFIGIDLLSVLWPRVHRTVPLTHCYYSNRVDNESIDIVEWINEPII